VDNEVNPERVRAAIIGMRGLMHGTSKAPVAWPDMADLVLAAELYLATVGEPALPLPAEPYVPLAESPRSRLNSAPLTEEPFAPRGWPAYIWNGVERRKAPRRG
jgi:hypothetical protein